MHSKAPQNAVANEEVTLLLGSFYATLHNAGHAELIFPIRPHRTLEDSEPQKRFGPANSQLQHAAAIDVTANITTPRGALRRLGLDRRC